MNSALPTLITTDGILFLIIGIVVLLTPSPQPGLTKKVNEDDLLPFSQTRRLLASMFIASALLLIVIGTTVNEPTTLRYTALVRIVSFLLVIILNAYQYRSKRWKAAPLVVLMSVFTGMSIAYLLML